MVLICILFSVQTAAGTTKKKTPILPRSHTHIAFGQQLILLFFQRVNPFLGSCAQQQKKNKGIVGGDGRSMHKVSCFSQHNPHTLYYCVKTMSLMPTLSSSSVRAPTRPPTKKEQVVLLKKFLVEGKRAERSLTTQELATSDQLIACKKNRNKSMFEGWDLDRKDLLLQALDLEEKINNSDFILKHWNICGPVRCSTCAKNEAKEQETVDLKDENEDEQDYDTLRLLNLKPQVALLELSLGKLRATIRHKEALACIVKLERHHEFSSLTKIHLVAKIAELERQLEPLDKRVRTQPTRKCFRHSSC
jgi:hypothetical protein